MSLYPPTTSSFQQRLAIFIRLNASRIDSTSRSRRTKIRLLQGTTATSIFSRLPRRRSSPRLRKQTTRLKASILTRTTKTWFGLYTISTSLTDSRRTRLRVRTVGPRHTLLWWMSSHLKSWRFTATGRKMTRGTRSSTGSHHMTLFLGAALRVSGFGI